MFCKGQDFRSYEKRGVIMADFSKQMDMVLYNSDDGEVSVNAYIKDEKVVVSKMETTTQHDALEGKTQTSETNFYSLDAIISVGYRVNSKKATQFRIWVT